MAQLLSQHFCTRCGIALEGDAEGNERFCANCQKSGDERSRQPGEQATDADATIRAAVRFVSGLLDERQENDEEEDGEKTVRASIRLSPRAYTLALRQEQHLLPASEQPTQPDPPPGQKLRHFVLLRQAKRAGRKKPLALISCVLGLVLLLALLLLGLAGYGGNPRMSQQVMQSKARLDGLLSQARAAGVPASMLQPVLKQEQQLDSEQGSLFVSGLFDAGRYQTLAKGYQALSAKMPGIVEQATKQGQARAQQDVQNFQVALSQAAVQGAASGPLDTFLQQFSQDQLALETAKTPDDYAVVSQNAR